MVRPPGWRTRVASPCFQTPESRLNPTHIPIRVATGASILNSGIGKLGADEGTAPFLHGAAAGTYPSVFKDMKPTTFARVLACSAIAVGGALLLPKVNATVAGAAKDVWLVGAGMTLVAQGVTSAAKSGVASSRKATKRAAKNASKKASSLTSR